MELLAPAGSPAHLIAALDAGADAVYLGGKRFSARKFAGNFSDEEMKEAVRTAHGKGASVYVTLNTLIGDMENQDLAEYLQFWGRSRLMDCWCRISVLFPWLGRSLRTSRSMPAHR